MISLVRDHGWVLLWSSGILGYNTGTAIEKDGIFLSYHYSKGDEDYDLRLCHPVHPESDVSLENQRNLHNIFKNIGIKFDASTII